MKNKKHVLPPSSKIQPRRAASAASNAKGYQLSDSNSSDEDEQAASPPPRRPAQAGQRVAHKPNAIVAASRRQIAVVSRAPTRKPQRSKYAQSSGDESSNSDDDSRRLFSYFLTFNNITHFRFKPNSSHNFVSSPMKLFISVLLSISIERTQLQCFPICECFYIMPNELGSFQVVSFFVVIE